MQLVHAVKHRVRPQDNSVISPRKEEGGPQNGQKDRGFRQLKLIYVSHTVAMQTIERNRLRLGVGRGPRLPSESLGGSVSVITANRKQSRFSNAIMMISITEQLQVYATVKLV